MAWQGTREDFVEYLITTLIPDLKESGRDATAEDFETAVSMIWVEEEQIENCAQALELNQLPVNPIPFADALSEGCRRYGSGFIKDVMGKRILWILMYMAFGQLAKIDLHDLWVELTAEVGHG